MVLSLSCLPFHGYLVLYIHIQLCKRWMLMLLSSQSQQGADWDELPMQKAKNCTATHKERGSQSESKTSRVCTPFKLLHALTCARLACHALQIKGRCCHLIDTWG